MTVSGLGTEITALEIRRADHSRHPLSAKIDTNFINKQQSLGIIHLQTKATEFSLGLLWQFYANHIYLMWLKHV
jgi:hypothetical protein